MADFKLKERKTFKYDRQQINKGYADQYLSI